MRAWFEAYEPARRWARANPHLAGTFPASEALRDVPWVKPEPCEPAVQDPHPVAGTYRMTVTAGPDTLSVYFRTAGQEAPDCRAAAVAPREKEAVTLDVHGAVTEAAIPAVPWEAIVSPCGIKSVQVVNRPETSDGERRWRAEYDITVLSSRCFPGSTGVPAALEALLRARDARFGPGVFREMPDGTVTFEQTWQAGGRPVAELRGTRVSRETIP